MDQGPGFACCSLVLFILSLLPYNTYIKIKITHKKFSSIRLPEKIQRTDNVFSVKVKEVRITLFRPTAALHDSQIEIILIYFLMSIS